MVIFKQWEDADKIKYLDIFLLLCFWVLFAAIYVDVPGERERANIYYMFVILSLIIVAIDFAANKNPIFEWLSFGRSYTDAFLAFAAGVITLFIVGITNFLTISAPFVVLPDVGLQFLYTVVSAPYIEEKTFRGSLQPTFQNIFIKLRIPFPDIMAVLLIASFFALFHGFAFSWEATGLLLAFFFSLLASSGNQVFKSQAFGLGGHSTNNLLAWLGKLGVAR